MSVSVEALSAQLGGKPPVLNFADTFNRADQPFFVGTLWSPLMSQGMLASGNNLAANCNVGGAQLTFTNPANVPNAWFMPTPISWNIAIARNQFCQVLVSAYNLGAGAQVTCGPGVWANLQGGLGTIGYYLRLENIAGVLNVRVAYGFSPITSFGANPINVGDVIRIEARNQGAQNQVLLLQNGVVIQTVNDNSGSRPTGGVYGIAWESGSVGGSCSFQNFSAGVL